MIIASIQRCDFSGNFLKSDYILLCVQGFNALKVPILFFKIEFSFVCWKSLLIRSKSKISVESVKPFGCTKQLCKLQLPILYCASLVMVTITDHIFTDISPREYLLAVKFLVGNEKNNMGQLLVPKSQKV